MTTRSYCVITAEQLAAHPNLHERPEVMLSGPDTATPMPASGDYIIGLRGVGTDPDEVTADGLENVAQVVLERIKGALMSKRRAHARVLGERLYADNDVPALIVLAAEQGVGLTGLTTKRQAVRAFMRHRYPEVATPKLTAEQALAWAESQTVPALRAWSTAHGLYVGHAPDKATAIQWLLTAEGYQGEAA